MQKYNQQIFGTALANSLNIPEEIAKLKAKAGGNIIVLGSSNLCISLLASGLLDEIRLMVNPVVIGKGTPLFHGIKEKYTVHLTSTRNFKNGNVLMTYRVK